mgnify:CR=1 FL=1
MSRHFSYLRLWVLPLCFAALGARAEVDETPPPDGPPRGERSEPSEAQRAERKKRHEEMQQRLHAACGSDIESKCQTASGRELMRCLHLAQESVSAGCKSFFESLPPPPRRGPREGGERRGPRGGHASQN